MKISRPTVSCRYLIPPKTYSFFRQAPPCLRRLSFLRRYKSFAHGLRATLKEHKMFKKQSTTIRLFISLVVLAAVCTTYLGTPVVSSASTNTNASPKAAKALKTSPQLRAGNHAAG